MRKLTSELLYWAIVLFVYWYATYDGPPIRTVVAYHGGRACQRAAYFFGRLGLALESDYYHSVGRHHG